MARPADTDGLTVVDRVVRNRGRPDPATFVGSGRADHLASVVRDSGAGLVIADGESSPGQARNLQDVAGCRSSTVPL